MRIKKREKTTAKKEKVNLKIKIGKFLNPKAKRFTSVAYMLLIPVIVTVMMSIITVVICVNSLTTAQTKNEALTQEIMDNISNLDPAIINSTIDQYKDELPIARLNMAKELVIRRANWMSEYYNKNKNESRVANRGNIK